MAKWVKRYFLLESLEIVGTLVKRTPRLLHDVIKGYKLFEN